MKTEREKSIKQLQARHNGEEATDETPRGLQLKFTPRKTLTSSPTSHISVLATPRPAYRGRDFFQRPDFRGLLIADH